MKRLLLFPITLACLCFTAGGAVLPAEKLLPDDTLLVFTIPDFTKAVTVYQSSPQGRLWNDPAMKPFKDKFVDKFKFQFITPLEHDLGIHFDDYTSLPQGQLTLAITQDGWQGKDDKMPALLLLLDTRDKSSQLKTSLADLKKKWIDAGKTVKTETIRAVEFSVVALSSNDIPKSLQKALTSSNSPPDSSSPDDKPDAKAAPKSRIYIGQADSLLIMGNSSKAIERVLASMSGGALKTLGDVPAYAANQAAMFRDSPLYGWVNAKALVDIFSRPDDSQAAADSSNPFAMKPDKIFTALGMKGLKSIAFNYLYSNDGAQFNIMFSVPEDSRAGLFKIMAGEPKDCNPPAFVPADAIKFQRWRIDGQKTWAVLQQMLGDINPQILNGLNFMLSTAESSAKEKDPSFDIKKNLFGNLGDDMISYQKKPKGNTLEEVGSPPSLFLSGSPNPEQLASALKSILALYSQQTTPTDRDFLGRKIYSLPLPAAPGVAGGATRSLNYCASGGYIAISTDAGTLEEYLRSSQGDIKSLRDVPGLSEATAKVGGSGMSLFGYSNESESVRALFDFLKNNASGAEGLGGNLAPLLGDAKFKDWVDVSLLPDYDKVAKYFYFSVYSGGTTPDGLSFKAFAPVSPQLKQ